MAHPERRESTFEILNISPVVKSIKVFFFFKYLQRAKTNIHKNPLVMHTFVLSFSVRWHAMQSSHGNNLRVSVRLPNIFFGTRKITNANIAHLEPRVKTRPSGANSRSDNNLATSHEPWLGFFFFVKWFVSDFFFYYSVRWRLESGWRRSLRHCRPFSSAPRFPESGSPVSRAVRQAALPTFPRSSCD